MNRVFSTHVGHNSCYATNYLVEVSGYAQECNCKVQDSFNWACSPYASLLYVSNPFPPHLSMAFLVWGWESVSWQLVAASWVELSSVNRSLPRIGQWVNMTPLTAMQLNPPKALPPAVRRLTPTLRQRMLLVLTMPLEALDTPTTKRTI